jgi:predicted metal-dependent phosphoesterase TrpH
LTKRNLGVTSFFTQNQCYADLHIHSIYSDGSLAPFEIIKASKELQLKVISLTDHDTVSGVEEMIALTKGEIEVIPAVEMSSNIGDLDIHILGYYIDYKDADLLEYLESFKKYRVKRVKKIIQKLSCDNIKLEFEQIKVVAKNCSLGRPHIAEVLLENGYVKSISEAFARYLGYHSPYYEPKKNIHSREVIQKIKNCKGVPVIAHPGIINSEQILYQLIMDGALGIEVWHPEHTSRYQQKFCEIALKNGLLMTGGSDYHGKGCGSARIGIIGCSQKEVEMLKKCRDKVIEGKGQGN